jgi:hypothetical protein
VYSIDKLGDRRPAPLPPAFLGRGAIARRPVPGGLHHVDERPA